MYPAKFKIFLSKIVLSCSQHISGRAKNSDESSQKLRIARTHDRGISSINLRFSFTIGRKIAVR